MGSIFNHEGRLMKFLSRISGIIILSLEWFLFSIPIFTIGAATTALYYSLNKSYINERGYSSREFLSSFKTNFKQSTVAWLIALVFYILAVIDFYILHNFSHLTKYPNMDYAILIILVSVVTGWTSYLFPYFARFEDKTVRTMKNAFIMAITNLPFTILLIILAAAAVLAVLAFPPVLFVIPALYTCIARFILERIFRKYMSQEDLETEENRNCMYTDETTE